MPATTLSGLSSAQSWDVFNSFMLEGSLDRLTKILSRYELFKQAVELPGDIVEAGVAKGAGLLYWAKLLQIFAPVSKRKVVGFDTFADFPTESDADRAFADAFCREASYSGVSTAALRDSAARSGVEHRIELVEGDVRRTMKRYVQDNPGFRIALLNLDFDVAPPTRTALECLYDRVVSGGVIILDEYGLAPCTEANAVDEFLRERNISVRMRSLTWNMSPTAYFVKP